MTRRPKTTMDCGCDDSEAICCGLCCAEVCGDCEGLCGACDKLELVCEECCKCPLPEFKA